MQCSRCQFENMPGLDRCMRCGTALSAPTGPIQIEPPRMPAWEKPFRAGMRFLRRIGLKSPKLPPMPPAVDKFLTSGFFSGFFSILPGIPQFFQRRFRSILFPFIAWLVLLGATFFFWGTPQAPFLFSVTLSVHVWIAMKGGVYKEFPELRDRIWIFMFFLVLYFMVYFYSSLLLFRLFGIQGGYSLVNAPAAKVKSLDYLWGKTRNLTFQRGDFVLANLTGVTNHGFRIGGSSGGFVRIVGLPGEKLEILNKTFVINGKPLDSTQFPVPPWILAVKVFSVVIPQDQYFIVAEFTGQGYNAGIVSSVCILSSKAFQAKAFLRWQPVRNRGFIESNP